MDALTFEWVPHLSLLIATRSLFLSTCSAFSTMMSQKTNSLFFHITGKRCSPSIKILPCTSIGSSKYVKNIIVLIALFPFLDIHAYDLQPGNIIKLFQVIQ